MWRGGQKLSLRAAWAQLDQLRGTFIGTFFPRDSFGQHSEVASEGCLIEVSGSVVTLKGHNKSGGHGGEGACAGHLGSRSRGNGSGQFLGRGGSGAWGPSAGCKGHAVARSVADG